MGGTAEPAAQIIANMEHEHVASDSDMSLFREMVPSIVSTQDALPEQGFSPSLGSLQEEEDEGDDEEAAERVMALTELVGESQPFVVGKLSKVYGRAARVRNFLSAFWERVINNASASELNLVDSMGETALHKAVWTKRDDVVQLLLDNPRFEKANITTTSTGRTALHYAAINGSADVCTLLLDHPSFDSANVADKAGRSALHYAAIKERAAICACLLKHPSFDCTHLCDNQWKTAVEYARKAPMTAGKAFDRYYIPEHLILID